MVTSSTAAAPERNRPTQERSRARREALLAAAMALLAEGGMRAVTARAVAARAGVPLAAVSYYFDSIQHLTQEALRRHITDRVAELEALADSAAAGRRSAEQVGERLVELLLARDRDATIAQFEVFLEAARNPALRECVAEVLDAFERFAFHTLAGLGARRPAEAAAAFVAVANGFAINGLARPRPPEADGPALFDAMRALFIYQIMDDAEAAHWHARLSRTPS
jgi:DNA-binding transcriptional regulator YbjK